MTDLGLDFRIHWCERHLEPYRPDWPEHATEAMLLLFDAVTADQRIIDAAGGQVEILPVVFAKRAPLCCFLGDETMEEIRAEAFAGDGPRLRAMRARQTAG